MYVAVESSKAAHRGCMPTYIRTYYSPTHVDRRGSHTQQTRSTEKDEDVNWVRTNMRTGKNHSVERGDALRKLYCNSVVSCTEALWNLHGIRADFPRNSLDFVKFLVTYVPYRGRTAAGTLICTSK